MKYMRLNYIVTNLYYYFFCLLVILASGSLIAYRVGPNRIDILIVIMGLPLLMKAMGKKRDFSITTIMGLFFAIYFFINFLNYSATWVNLIRYISLLMIMFVFGLQVSRSNIKIHVFLYRIILFIASYSLVLFLLISVLRLQIPFTNINPFDSITPYRSYSGVYYSLSAINIGGTWILRNNSIFWEPGLYQIFLNFALYAYLFLDISKKRKHLTIILLSILSTFSATGIILATMLVVYYIIQKQSNTKKNIPLKLIISIILLVAVTSVSGIILSEKSQSSVQSFQSRTSDIELGLMAFIQKPIIGHGYFNEDVFFSLQTRSNVYWHHERGNSNGLINLAYMQGLIGLIIYFFPLVYSKSFYRKRSDKIAFLMFFLISNMTAPLYQTAFMILWVGLSYGSIFVHVSNKYDIPKRNVSTYKEINNGNYI